MLAGYQFNKRLAVGTPRDFVLLFNKAHDRRDVMLVAWTTYLAPRDVMITASPGTFAVTSMLSEKRPALSANHNRLPIQLLDSPQYIAPDHPNDLLRLAAQWERAPLEIIATRAQLQGDTGVRLELP